MEKTQMLTFEFRNQRTIDLIDLTNSLQAIAKSFQDYAAERESENIGNIRLGIRELRSGSVIADLIPTSEQISWIIDHRALIAGFVASLNDIAQFFLVGKVPETGTPTKKEAERMIQIVEPVAKDFGSQINVCVSDQAQVNFHVTYLDANAVQNGARRMLSPTLPAEFTERGVLLVLEQIRNKPDSKTGDRGIIEKIAQKPVKLRFLTQEAKMAILDMPDNPLKCAFLVDAKVHTSSGEPRLYEIIAVIDTIAGD